MAKVVNCENAMKEIIEKKGVIDSIKKEYRMPKELKQFSKGVVEDFIVRDVEINKALQLSTESSEMANQSLELSKNSVSKDEFENFKNNIKTELKECKDLSNHINSKLSDGKDKEILREMAYISRKQYWATTILLLSGLVITILIAWFK